MLMEKGSKLVMIGDSVTDVGRARPVGEAWKNDLGEGYPAFVNSLLTLYCPEAGIRVVNMGVSGDTVKKLEARWKTDVLDLKPDYVSILIGINDVWRQVDHPFVPEEHILPEEYEATYERLILATKDQVKNIFLLTPFFFEPNKSDRMRAMVDQYGAIVKRLAQKHNLPCIDFQAEADRALEHFYSEFYTWDRVHPEKTGHLMFALAFVRAMGVELH